MAVPYTGLATVKPSGPVGDPFQRISVPVGAFGGGAAAGAEKLGQGLTALSLEFGQIAADDATNQYIEKVNKIVNGDPDRTTVGPDGKPVADVGFMGLKGRAALESAPSVMKSLESAREETLGKLTTLQQRRLFNDQSRRYQTLMQDRVSAHARVEQNRYADSVFKSQAGLALEEIASNPDNPTALLEARERLRQSRASQAQLAGGGPEAVEFAIRTADRDALAAQIESIGVTNPARAMRMIEQGKATLGTRYDEMSNKLRVRGEQQEGREIADGMLTVPVGDDTKAMIRHFEGFRETAYWDVNAWRVGYGSDTITRPDGKVEKVTKDTVITRADAERDLERRSGQFAGGIVQKIGKEAWDRLAPEARASLTSIAYNYGSLPDRVVDAAKSGDNKRIAEAIRGLAGDNAGVNRRRRHQEARNLPGESRTQADLVSDIDNDPALADKPYAKAAAKARIDESYRRQQSAETKREAEFKQREADSLAEAQQTGQASKPLTEYDFQTHYGPSKGPAAWSVYQSNLEFGADWKNLQTMSDVEQRQFLDRRQAERLVPGRPGYDQQVKNQQRLEKAVTQIQEMRRDDPARAADQVDSVKQAYAQVDPKRPETVTNLARARLEAQRLLGIEPEFRSPITKAEALKEMAPVRAALPGMKSTEIEKAALKFRELYREDAPKAFIYALRAINLTGLAAEGAEGVLDDLASGKPITAEQRQQLRNAQAEEAMTRAAQGKKPEAPPDPWMTFSEMPSPVQEATPAAPSGDKGTPPKRVPNNLDIRKLRDNPQTEKEFDAEFGAGKAKWLRENFPFYFNRKPNGR